MLLDPEPIPKPGWFWEKPHIPDNFTGIGTFTPDTNTAAFPEIFQPMDL
jgi:hypothetical protein